jgi:large subunit ribosomal protein L18
MDAAAEKRRARERRHARVRKTVRGDAQRPRLAVYRSNAAIYAQVIDDRQGRTLAAASSLEKDVTPEGSGKIGVATAVGKLVAERAKAAGVEAVVFDRGGNRYQGRVAALADGAREAGLKF